MARNRQHYQIIWALGMLVLFVVVAFAPVAGGLLKHHHRTVRQGTLRRGRIEMPVTRIILADTAVAGCFAPKEKELLVSGLRYDVVSVHREGNYFIFNAVLDLKETKLSALLSQNIQGLPVTSGEKIGFALTDCLLHPYVLPLLPQSVMSARSVFFEKKAGELAGFKRVYAPPPDLYRLL